MASSGMSWSKGRSGKMKKGSAKLSPRIAGARAIVGGKLR